MKERLPALLHLSANSLQLPATMDPNSDYAVLHPDNAMDASLKGIVDQQRYLPAQMSHASNESKQVTDSDAI